MSGARGVFVLVLCGVVSGALSGCKKKEEEKPATSSSGTTTNTTTAVKRIFVTSASYDGNLGGLSGADAKCNTHAAGANLGGTWKAWLSDSNTDAIDRISDVGPWYLVDNQTKIFNNKANLATTPITNISKNEFGGTVNNGQGTEVWTGTLQGGTKATPAIQNLCQSLTDWQSQSDSVGGLIGHSGTNLSIWTSYQGRSCSGVTGKGALYCLEQ